MIKKFLILVLILASGTLIWFGFGLWTGIYAIYSFPPSKDRPEGATLIVTRDAGERLFNSPDTPKPKKKPVAAPSGGITFSAAPKQRRPLRMRTIIELPFVEWAYTQSLEPLEEETP